ncbi:aldo/keto reductase [Mesorhizobium sp. BR1-1-16]|uniref:aldo/keto reductase n=1 Tax=Mesorhizobium sp. BR1-1-16 TaxID=2876653 RepID=UPI001CCC2A3A|nr:aldo/keto reductase [Mesorhizobium sp. BR1-1-16]MBZ9936328.1 aldo/keto reductase [Mesorhizobium sp. BR1-1-16]
MSETSAAPARLALPVGFEIPRIATGLWQIADMERDGKTVDIDAAAASMLSYARAGFDAFDMADHYGSAELITGRFLKLAKAEGLKPFVSTKWCPTPGPMTREVVRAGVQRSLDRLGVDSVDLMQFHWWSFEHPAYLDALAEMEAMRSEGIIRHLGLTNFDTDHLALVVRNGITIATNQVSFSLLDRRAADQMSAFCLANDIRLLAYGTMGGGWLSERWLGAAEPEGPADWSKMKYRRFVDAIGGWDALQGILAAAAGIARKHGVSLSNVATRWVLDHPAVAAVIIGARLGEREHRADNLKAFAFHLDAEDRAHLDAAFAASTPLPGDCGDEYRKPPFLTASGDLSHHLASLPQIYQAEPIPGKPGRLRVDSGSIWEPIAGYSRAVRIGERILVSGTTATHTDGSVICPGDIAGQTTYILDKIAASISALGGSLDDVIRTRVYLKNAKDWEPASRVHGRFFGHIRPANTLLEVGALVGPYEIEIEAEAVVDAA